ncbi:MAG: (deoxy)nucleoside triphosphate pyrophosphohydrolase [Coriobacteriales bacterium]|nr:(deoxy)nucleoside triphosphate pyrophosphohydrolase [Coriobacteriales bacterium]
MDEHGNKPILRVACAIIWRDNLVLACKRTSSKAGAGWEFPGGQIEGDETPMQACKREVAEELSCRLSTTWLLQTLEYDYPEFHLSMDCFVSMLVPGSEPQANEHAEIRWLSRDELTEVEWLPADAELARVIGTMWDNIFMSEHM